MEIKSMSSESDLNLVDPDSIEENETAQYSWDEEFQRHIVALILADRQFLLQSIDLVKPSYFTNRAHYQIVDIVFKFFNKYRILPRKEFIEQEIKNRIKKVDQIDFYLGELSTLTDYFNPGLEARDYLLDKIVYFARLQKFRKAFNNGVKILSKNPEDEENWQRVYDLMNEVVTTTSNFDIGTDYFNSIRDRYIELQEESHAEDRFITGFVSIDSQVNGGGYSKGEIISVMAGPGVGKSVFLSCVAATNLLRKKRGVYITLELSEKKVADRMDAILTGTPIQCLLSRKDEVFEKISQIRNMYDDEEVPFIIKQFPSGQATVNTIRAYLSQLKFHGYCPDFIIVDYIGEMKDVPGKQKHESREDIVRDLRGLASEEGIFIATAMQPNRSFKEEQKGNYGKIDDVHLADSFGQSRPLDGFFSLNQSDIEKKLGIGRCYVIKQRDGKSRYQFYLRFDPESLKITEITKELYLQIRNKYNDEIVQEIEMDKIKKEEVSDAWEEF